jgi:putative Holliday junction resolvase
LTVGTRLAGGARPKVRRIRKNRRGGKNGKARNARNARNDLKSRNGPKARINLKARLKAGLPETGSMDERGIIALDVGLKRVGVAATDPAGLTAQPIGTWDRRPHGLFMERLAALAAERGAGTIVLGLPRRTDGRLGPEAQRVMALAHQIRSRLGLEVETSDERLTTAMADRTLRESGLSGPERGRVIDQAAAVIILAGWLDGRAWRGGRTGPDGREG